MPEHFHSAAKRKRSRAVLPALFVLVGFIAGIAVASLFSAGGAAVSSDADSSPPPPPPPATDSAETSTDKVVETAYLSRSELAAPVLETADALTEARVLLELDQLAFYFEAGCYWNHYGIDVSSMSDLEQAMCVTDSACAHSENGYDFCNIYNGAMSEAFPEYDYETQCLGYASLISDLLFGTDAPVTEFYDFDDLRIGDHIRLVQNEHSMIVTDIDWSTDTITVTEVNADYENCQISWGRTITRDELYSMEGEATFYTRYTA